MMVCELPLNKTYKKRITKDTSKVNLSKYLISKYIIIFSMTIYFTFVKYVGYKDEYNKILHLQKGSRLAVDSFHNPCQICTEQFTIWTFRELYKRSVYIYLLKRKSSELLARKLVIFLTSVLYTMCF